MVAQHHLPALPASRTTSRPLRLDPAFQAFFLLRIAFTVAPILFGIDKFTHLMSSWDAYLAPQLPELFHVPARTFMYGVGAIEIAAGLAVLVRPRFGGYLVAVWLAGIIANLLLVGGYLDIALRDFGLMIAALALARLAAAFPGAGRDPAVRPEGTRAS